MAKLPLCTKKWKLQQKSCFQINDFQRTNHDDVIKIQRNQQKHVFMLLFFQGRHSKTQFLSRRARKQILQINPPHQKKVSHLPDMPSRRESNKSKNFKIREEGRVFQMWTVAGLRALASRAKYIDHRKNYKWDARPGSEVGDGRTATRTDGELMASKLGPRLALRIILHKN